MIDTNWQGLSFNSWRGFSFGDLDEDGDLDLLFASIEHYNLRFYRNIGTQFSVVMEFETDEFLPGFEIQGSFPYLVDIDNDNDLDLFIGDAFAGAYFFRNWGYNSVNHEPVNQPYTFTLYQNYPNPFNASTAISFQLQAASYVSLRIFDITGRSVGAKNLSPLQNQYLSSGYHEIVWDASGVASGVYLVRLSSLSGAFSHQQHSTVRKVMLVK